LYEKYNSREGSIWCFLHVNTYSIYRLHSPVLSQWSILLKILVSTLEILVSIASGEWDKVYHNDAFAVHSNGQPDGSPTRRGKSEKTTRVRTVLNEKQLHTLRTCYAANPRPDAMMKEQLVEMTGLSPRVIRVWFQNKRCKDKKKSMMLNKTSSHHQHQGAGSDDGQVMLNFKFWFPGRDDERESDSCQYFRLRTLCSVTTKTETRINTTYAQVVDRVWRANVRLSPLRFVVYKKRVSPWFDWCLSLPASSEDVSC